MIDEHSRREMRTVGGTGRERAVINDCGWTGGMSSRKALLMIAGEAGRMLTLDDLREIDACLSYMEREFGLNLAVPDKLRGLGSVRPE